MLEIDREIQEDHRQHHCDPPRNRDQVEEPQTRCASAKRARPTAVVGNRMRTKSVSTTTTPRLFGQRQRPSDGLLAARHAAIPRAAIDDEHASEGGEPDMSVRSSNGDPDRHRVLVSEPIDTSLIFNIFNCSLNDITWRAMMSSQIPNWRCSPSSPPSPNRWRTPIAFNCWSSSPRANAPSRSWPSGPACRSANASQHLQHMWRAGLAGHRRDGKFVYYRLADDAVIDLLTALRRIAEQQRGRSRTRDPYLL